MGKKPVSYEVDKDNGGKLQVTGRYQQVPVDPTEEFKRPTLAAGAVLWRGDLSQPESVEVAVIHRPHYDDWSLAKGKVDPGESLPTAAAREILEETGFEVRLGKLLGKVSYPVAGRTKVVYYWTAQVLSGEFAPNDEVDELRWASIEEAKRLLSYDVDAGVLDKAAKRFALPSTARVLYVRHGRAFKRGQWAGDDDLRPLDKKGRRQAEMLVPMLLPYRPERIFSAEPDRCQATAAPLADELNFDVEVDPLFGDEGWLEDSEACRRRFAEVVEDGGTSVIVSQGTAMPKMLRWLSEHGRLPLPEELKVKKGGVWVLAFADGELTGADYLASALPLK